MSGRRPSRVTAQQTTPTSTTPTRAAKVFYYVITHAQSTLTLQPSGGEIADQGSSLQPGIWSHLLLWLPYGLFTFFLVALVVASFVSFHRKNGHKYRRRRSDIWRDLDMHSLFENMHQQISPHARTDQSNGGNVPPELQSLLATCPAKQQQSQVKVKPRSKEPIRFAANANGSMIDVRYADRAPPTTKDGDTTANSSSAFALVHVRSSNQHNESSNDVSANQRSSFDVVTLVSESQPNQYKTRKVDKKLTRSRTSAEGGDDRDDVIRLVLRGSPDNDVIARSDAAVTQSVRPGPLKSQRTLPSSPVPLQTSRGRQLPQPPIRL